VKRYLQRSRTSVFDGKAYKMFSSHCGLGLSIFTRRWEHRRFEDDFVARVVTLYAGNSTKFSIQKQIRPSNNRSTSTSSHSSLRGQNVVKDGIHIIFKNVHLTATIQQLIRQRVVTKFEPILTSHLQDLLNSADDVLDAHATTNNWQMYGSRKPGRIRT
jgi:hypothetical protein